MNWIKGRNDVRLAVWIDGALVSHFRLCEFENEDGLAMIHTSTLTALEHVRHDLCEKYGEEVWVIITSAIRTEGENERLAAWLGWTDDGGLVSRDSKHLVKYGGIAVDFVAVVASSRQRVQQSVVGGMARKYFDWVKDDYSDGHVHGDMRNVKTK